VFVIYVVVTVVTLVANLVVAVAGLFGARFVLDNIAEVGVSMSWVPWLSGLKGAGALGLLVGLLGADWAAIAAATGLVLFFTGAVVAHVRARALHTLAFPGTFWLLAAASLVLAVAQQ
jgi:DoxX-like family